MTEPTHPQGPGQPPRPIITGLTTDQAVAKQIISAFQSVGFPVPKERFSMPSPHEIPAGDIPGWEGSVGPAPGQYGKPHVYARDVHSGAGNCVCGGTPGDTQHVQIAPGVDVPAWMRPRS